MTQLQSAARTHRRRLLAVFGITLAILATEVVGGLLSGSLALLADAGHMLTDVSGIGLSLLAMWFATRPATPRRSFGYYRLEILAAVGNAVLLFGVSGLILFGSVRRLFHPAQVGTGLMLVFAVVALAGNGASVWLLRRGQAESLNVRGAFLEVLSDLLGALAVLVAAAVIALTGFRAADPIASGLIGLAILPRTWKLLRDAVDVLLEATPRGVDLGEVRKHILEMSGVADVHDLHAWTITSGINVVSAHVVCDGTADAPTVLDRLCDCLSGDFDIEHSTFQLETGDRRRIEETAHP
jgi:cobalt-zinc-cadmium efflux system protein